MPESHRPSDPPPAPSGARSPRKSLRLSRGGCASSGDSQARPSSPGPSPSARGQHRAAAFGAHPGGSHPPAAFLSASPPLHPGGAPRSLPAAHALAFAAEAPSRGSRTQLSGARRADWACSGARPRAVGTERMHSPGRGFAVQGRGAQAAALADALASLRRTRARMASLTAYGTAGGRAGAVRGSRAGTPETFGVRLCLRGRLRESRTVGLRHSHPPHGEDAWSWRRGYLPVESGGTSKGSH